MKKILRISYFSVCFSLMLTAYAYAYLDPSVMTYAVQVVAGIAVAVGAVVGIGWRRAKRRIFAKLGIDGNAQKEVEDDVVEYTEDQTEAELTGAGKRN